MISGDNSHLLIASVSRLTAPAILFIIVFQLLSLNFIPDIWKNFNRLLFDKLGFNPTVKELFSNGF
jgi:hypothetical protein